MKTLPEIRKNVSSIIAYARIEEGRAVEDIITPVIEEADDISSILLMGVVSEIHRLRRKHMRTLKKNAGIK